MYLQRIREYGPNFGLYKVVLVHKEDRIMDESGRTLPETIHEGMVVGVTETCFVGKARGKTGRHDLWAENTRIIYAENLKKSNGKYNAHRWALEDQAAIDELYRQRLAYSI